MSDAHNDAIFEQMVDDAIKKVADKGHEQADVKDITLVAYGLMTRNMTEKLDSLGNKIRKPTYFIAAAIASAVIAYIVNNIFLV